LVDPRRDGFQARRNCLHRLADRVRQRREPFLKPAAVLEPFLAPNAVLADPLDLVCQRPGGGVDFLVQQS
jgi:hypothetical protein